MNKSLIILTLLLNSCMTGKQISKTGVEEVHFGTGGGFTGVETFYVLNQDGDIKDKNDSVVHNMTRKDVLAVFEQASKNKDVKLNKPENLYSFITIVTKSDTNRIVWGQETTSVPPDILTLHENLMNRTTETK